jgi:hypothetical protein
MPCFDFAQHSCVCGLSEVETHNLNADRPLVLLASDFSLPTSPLDDLSPNAVEAMADRQDGIGTQNPDRG